MLPRKEEVGFLSFRSLCRFFMVTSLVVVAWPAFSASQEHIDALRYGRVNSLGIFGAYSGDSSHILLGDAENRRLLGLGVAYSRRLAVNNVVNWQYDAEFLPLVFESDPMGHIVDNQTSPTAYTYIYGSAPAVTCAQETVPYTSFDPGTGTTLSGTFTISCYGRRWVAGEAMSPAGLRWNFLPTHKLQPFVDGHGGFMYSSQPVPVDQAGSFNFTFDIGAGFELYRTRTKSIRAEFRYHHISNNNTATSNPGIDNGLIQLTYSFGFGPQ
jgi:opacity protein-like surface antigen